MRYYNILLIVGLCLMISEESSALLRAGVGKTNITPPIGGSMYGYSARGKNVSVGVHDSLYARALALDDGSTRLAICSLDIGTIDAEMTANIRQMVSEETGIQNTIITFSHTHSGPTIKRDFPSSESPWIVEAERKIVDAIVSADKNLTKARFGVGWGKVCEGHNRRIVCTNGKVLMYWANRERIPTSPVDYQLAVIRIEDMDKKSIANLYNFTCHPVVLGPENLLISADYPYEVARQVESAIGGQCMFFQGAAGDINPFWDKTPPDEGAYEAMEKMGKAIADQVVKISKQIVEFEDDAKISFGSKLIPLASRSGMERKSKTFKAELNTVLIGKDLAIATFPGEFFVEHGLSLKKRSQIKNTIFVGYCNDNLRYFPTIQACAEGGYGASSATMVEVGAGELLVNQAIISLYFQAGLIAD